MLEELLNLNAYDSGLVTLPGWNMDEFTDLWQLLCFAKGELALAVEEEDLQPFVAAVYTRQDAQKVVSREIPRLPIFLITGDMRHDPYVPDQILDVIDDWQVTRGIPLGVSFHTHYEAGAHVAAEVGFPMTPWDRAWVAAIMSDDVDALSEYHDSVWAQQRHRLLVASAVSAWQQAVRQRAACRVITGPMLEWATRPHGPIARVAKRTFDQMRE
ncbi:MAG: hypothetical protein EOO77_14620 [Oxalobacteraceae bacterium]|nr:MAG: hypothetical protein EOO77_14620 [Oxalobacteraceae bacterium]